MCGNRCKKCSCKRSCKWRSEVMIDQIRWCFRAGSPIGELKFGCQVELSEGINQLVYRKNAPGNHGKSATETWRFSCQSGSMSQPSLKLTASSSNFASQLPGSTSYDRTPLALWWSPGGKPGWTHGSTIQGPVATTWKGPDQRRWPCPGQVIFPRFAWKGHQLHLGPTLPKNIFTNKASKSHDVFGVPGFLGPWSNIPVLGHCGTWLIQSLQTYKSIMSCNVTKK